MDRQVELRHSWGQGACSIVPLSSGAMLLICGLVREAGAGCQLAAGRAGWMFSRWAVQHSHVQDHRLFTGDPDHRRCDQQYLPQWLGWSSEQSRVVWASA